MRYACVLNGARSFNAFLDLVCEAEAAGWDGFFLPDGLAIKGIQLFDPWVMMGIAARTSRIRFGAMITPVSRRRPWKLAKECATVDHLSKRKADFRGRSGSLAGRRRLRKGRRGRRYQGAGPASRRGVGDHGRVMEREAVLVFRRAFQGRQDDDESTAAAKAAHPIWVVGVWEKPKSMRRALTWDGIIANDSTTSARFHGTTLAESPSTPTQTAPQAESQSILSPVD